jgi:hypothetical protein
MKSRGVLEIRRVFVNGVDNNDHKLSRFPELIVSMKGGLDQFNI